MMLRRLIITSALMLCSLSATGQELQDSQRSVFDHEEHRGLFPSCLTCHVGASEVGAMFPQTSTCMSCHDGVIEQRVNYSPRSLPPNTNLAFDHAEHMTNVTAADGVLLQCVQCHAEPDAGWMSVQLTNVDRCLNCHEETQGHYEVSDQACAGCHVPLADANRLAYEDVAAFPTPRSHQQPDFGGALHGFGARGQLEGSVSASCATCHARNFCITCHVDAPEEITIQALRMDARSLAHRATLAEPPSHSQQDFLATHGTESLASPSSCLTCHTQENCTVCHTATPEVASALHRTGPGRAVGPTIDRSSPQSHDSFYRSNHASEASAVPTTCAGCHARQDCLDCHRPDGAMGPGGYHELGFLTRHPSAAYARETTCSDCHNDRNFCASCHLSTGLTSSKSGVVGSGYHDAKQAFTLGHGVAARQNLETCVTCHVERDCLSCHSATGSRRFSPHGPGFDAERLRARNPEMCTACHIRIPNQ